MVVMKVLCLRRLFVLLSILGGALVLASLFALLAEHGNNHQQQQVSWRSTYDIGNELEYDEDDEEEEDDDDFDNESEEDDLVFDQREELRNAVFRPDDFDPLPPTLSPSSSTEATTSLSTAIEKKWLRRKRQKRRRRRTFFSVDVTQAAGDTLPFAVPELPMDHMNSLRSREVLQRKDGTDAIVHKGMMWSQSVENSIPHGVNRSNVGYIMERMRSMKVQKMQAPTWLKCGRPKNQFLTFSDGSHACARYRRPHNYLTAGEVLSFYLAQLLEMQHVPVVVLSKAHPESIQWENHNSSAAFKNAGWIAGTTVALIQWIDGRLQRERMPDILLSSLHVQEPVSISTLSLQDLDESQLGELAQWSDLVVFDYLTANYDRVASMQDAADKESRPEIMTDTIHNLVKSRSKGTLWFIDNESGILDGYSLMYSPNQGSSAGQGERFIRFHEQVLQTMCIFRESTVKAVARLHQHGYSQELLATWASQQEPLLRNLSDPFEHPEFVKYFQKRVDSVWQWMRECDMRTTYGRAVR